VGKSKDDVEVSPKRKIGWYKGLHHILPSSRGGNESRENMYPKERWGKRYKQKHDNYHILFVNLKPKEAVEKIAKYCDRDGKVSEEFFHTIFAVENKGGITERKTTRGPGKRKRAWGIVFGAMNGFEAIEWIEREFIRKEWLTTSSPPS